MVQKSVLVYTGGEVLGDGVIKIPFIRALKKAIPDAKIVWLCSENTLYTSVLNPMVSSLIDEIVVFPINSFGWKKMFTKSPLHGRYFDIIIDTQKRVMHTIWLKSIPHNKFFSAAARYVFSSAKLDKPSNGTIFGDLMALGSLAAGVSLQSERISIPQEWDEAAKKLLPDGKVYIGFISGAGQPFKCWPLDRFISLAKAQEEKGRVPVFFLGPKEKEIGDILQKEMPSALFPLDNAKDPRLTIALGKRLSAAVANDSGGGHLLAAAGTPMVSLFHKDSFRKKFPPASPKVIAFAAEDFGGCDKVSDIPYDAVVSALEKLLSENREGK